jgi:hypothetical protein
MAHLTYSTAASLVRSGIVLGSVVGPEPDSGEIKPLAATSRSHKLHMARSVHLDMGTGDTGGSSMRAAYHPAIPEGSSGEGVEQEEREHAPALSVKTKTAHR